MVKKTQLRKYSLEKIMELVATQTNGQNLKMYNQAIADRNATLLAKRNELLKELEHSRHGLEKIFYEMNDGVKDRIKLKSKIVMDREIRPSREDIKEVTELFTYIENQFSLIQRNSSDLTAENAKLIEIIESLKAKAVEKVDYTDLDEQYIQLNQQCSGEEEVRNALQKQREANLKHYNSIASSIEQYRVEYQLVEARIREQERELIQLTTYLQARKKQDEQVLSDLRDRNMDLQQQLLKAQEILNSNSRRCEGLMIREIEALNHPQ